MKPASLNGKLTVSLLASVLILSMASINPAWGNPAEISHLQKAKNLSKAGQWNKAVKEFNQALAEEPENGYAHAGLGVALSMLGRHKDALLAYEEAIQFGYDHPMFRYNRGISFARLHLLEEAEKEFKTALKMNPRLGRAKFDLGVVYKLQGRNEEALKQVDKLYKRHTKNTLAKKLFDMTPPLYKGMSVDHGGSLTGRVKFTGPKSPARVFQLINMPNIEFCSRMSDGKGHRLVHDFKVSETGGLKDTIIAISGIKRGKPFPPSIYSLKIRLCHAKDYVIGIRNGVDFLIENMDPIKHELATYEINGPEVFQTSNKSVIAHSSQVRSTFSRSDTQELLIRCNLHPFLQTQAYIVDNPYFAVTDEEGRFSIKDIPPGTYEVTAWHPFIPTQKGKVTITADGETKLDFTFNSKDANPRPMSHTLNRNLFTVIYDRFENFYGGKRVDDPIEILQKY
ncbi:MAG: tetratricopeptide repeat protein [Nitrospinales bacterium]